MYPDKQSRQRRKHMIDLQMSAMLRDRDALNNSIRMLEKEKAILSSLDDIDNHGSKPNMLTDDAENDFIEDYMRRQQNAD
jgi:hypothetical protein